MSNPRSKSSRWLWAVQALLALTFLFAGVSKFVLPADKMTGPVALPIGFIKFIGACEILGALGLLLPGLFHIRERLTAAAAVGLVLIMIGATVVTVMGGAVLPALFPLVVGALAATVAYGRRDWRWS